MFGSYSCRSVGRLKQHNTNIRSRELRKMLSKKHYKAIAEILRQAREQDIRTQIDFIAERLSDYFKQDNKNFNHEKFKEAIYKLK